MFPSTSSATEAIATCQTRTAPRHSTLHAEAVATRSCASFSSGKCAWMRATGSVNWVQGISTTYSANQLLAGWVARQLGRTALHYAADRDDARICNALLDVGAPYCAEDRDGMMPVDLAHCQETTDIFLSAGRTFWTFRGWQNFGRDPAVLMITTLLCAKRRGLHLPVELWLHIMTYLQRKDFPHTCEQ
eukprot:m.30831 g.30831  ORF g.30831 m.30831 type:complete len:189 (-) comp5263_c0_seq2:241-807(-)